MADREFDSVVIGGGSAGYAAARTLAAGGAKAAVVDGAKELGGLCILRGCMPTKALLHAAELRQAIREASDWGIDAGPVSIDLVRMFGRKSWLIDDFAGYRRKQLGDGRFELIRSTASFVDEQTLVLGDGSRIRAGHFVIATGSVISPPPIAGMAEAGFLTSDTALELARLPESLIVLGAGAVAVEFAQFFARLGVKVSVVLRGDHLLRASDPDAAGEVEKAFRREGIDVFTGAHIESVEVQDGKKVLRFKKAGRLQEVAASEIFHGLGRRPNTTGLGLDRAGVKLDADRIVTDEAQRTSAKTIFAAGDCCGPHEIVHLAVQQGEIAAHNILHPGRTRTMDYRMLLSVVFTEPQLAQVGLTEHEAARRKIPVITASYPFNDHGKSMILGSQEGFVKLIADPATGELLGGACVGPQGGELIHEVAVAMAARMTAAQFAAVPHYHPTLAEIWTYPAEELAEQVTEAAVRS
jgi:pyruvate/2-oxoglutarate dehydrogenase complex dihydrolipoamide dehydrogenase (E3) component